MPTIKVTNNNASEHVIPDPAGGSIGTVPANDAESFDLSHGELDRIKGDLEELDNTNGFTVELTDSLTDQDDMGLPEEYDLKAAGKSGIFRGDMISLVDPTHSYATDDDDLRTPFASIQAALDAIGDPTTQEEQDLHHTVIITDGEYGETLDIPSFRDITLIAYGEVGIDAVNWDIDSSVDQGGSGSTLTLKSATSIEDGGLFGRGFVVANDITVTAQQSGATALLYAKDISTGLVATDTNLDTVAVRFSRAFVGTCDAPRASLRQAVQCRFNENVTLDTYQHITNCVFTGDLTISSFSFSPSNTNPMGMYNTSFSGEFSAPVAESLVLDAATNWFFNNHGGTLAGSATKKLIHDDTV